MRDLPSVEAILGPVTARWTCRSCGEEQLGFLGQEPPPDHVCDRCSAPPPPALEDRLRSAGLPPVLLPYVGSRSRWESHFRRAWPAELAAWQGSPPMLYAFGETGTGKSTAAAILLAQHLAHGGRGLWLDGIRFRTQLLREVRGEAAVELMDVASKAPFLVWDEPLAGRLTDWAVDQVFSLARERHESQRITVVTSQLDPAALLVPMTDAAVQTSAPPALVSRLLSGLRVYFGGEDVRLREGA